jgi:hypothetical protein
VFKVVIPDNMAAIVADADAVNPRLTVGRLDYARHCGYVTDPTRSTSKGPVPGPLRPSVG